MDNIIIDIGASNLFFSNKLAKKNPKTKIIAIDPLIQDEKKKFNNIITYKIALDITEKEKNFYIAGNHGDCSSLLDLDTSKIEKSDTITLNTVKLYSLLNKLNFDFIEYIQIDTQGNDLNVLRSCEEFIHKIIYGNIECIANKKDSLYKNQYDLREALNYLNDNNFNIDHIIPNNSKSNEFNVFFSHKTNKSIKPNYENYVVKGFNDFKNLNCNNYSFLKRLTDKLNNKIF